MTQKDVILFARQFSTMIDAGLPIIQCLDILHSQQENKTVKVDDFRYPGPKPRSRETAVLMLADAAEAATRSLARPTPSRIREMVKQIIDKRMLAGELDNSGLTLRDLAIIRESFIPLLTGIHHARIAYPGQRQPKGERGRGDGGGDEAGGRERDA